MNIQSATILITGASQGIGQQMAIYFAKKGAQVIIAARNKSKLDETLNLINVVGGNATALVLDLSDVETIQSLANHIQALGKHVDILINNAANCNSKPLLDTSLEEIDSIVRTNVIGCFQLCRLIAPSMVSQRGGVIVNISSLAGYNPNAAQTVYSTSKAAVNALSEALRDELAPKGIQVINVAMEVLALDQQKASGINVEQFAKRLESAIQKNEYELFLSPFKKWLMRLYKFLPVLPRLKRALNPKTRKVVEPILQNQ
jgi:3-oxoacyl-[acyl-carrier protein] reductase